MHLLTPQTEEKELAKALGVKKLFFKREDKHIYASHKGRSIPVMIDKYLEEGKHKFIISSSGNAALAAISYLEEQNILEKYPNLKLIICVGEKIGANKLTEIHARINYNYTELKQVTRPKQYALQYAREHDYFFLRQSNDDLALLGYESLAEELATIPDLGAIFIPSSSGTTAQALGEYFTKANQNIQIHISQTTSCYALAREFYTKDELQNLAQENSLAGAIVDNIAFRKTKLLPLIKASQGRGWIISNSQIQEAIALVKKFINLNISPNSALSIAALIEAQKQKWKFPENSAMCCLITGR